MIDLFLPGTFQRSPPQHAPDKLRGSVECRDINPGGDAFFVQVAHKRVG
jgi:hypothetical protein